MLNYKTRTQTRKTTLNPYLVQKIMSASKEELINYIYDAGATACAQKDSVKARNAVNLLIQSLNFDYEETANTFLNVYRYLMHLINQKQFDEARKQFLEIKKTWAKAFKLM